MSFTAGPGYRRRHLVIDAAKVLGRPASFTATKVNWGVCDLDPFSLAFTENPEGDRGSADAVHLRVAANGVTILSPNSRQPLLSRKERR
jgi:hypothetical protein